MDSTVRFGSLQHDVSTDYSIGSSEHDHNQLVSPANRDNRLQAGGSRDGNRSDEVQSRTSAAVVFGLQALKDQISAEKQMATSQTTVLVERQQVETLGRNTDLYTELLKRRFKSTSRFPTFHAENHHHHESSIERARHGSSTHSRSLPRYLLDQPSSQNILSNDKYSQSNSNRANGMKENANNGNKNVLNNHNETLNSDGVMRPLSELSMSSVHSNASSIYRLSDKQRRKLDSYSRKLKQVDNVISQELAAIHEQRNQLNKQSDQIDSQHTAVKQPINKENTQSNVTEADVKAALLKKMLKKERRKNKHFRKSNDHGNQLEAHQLAHSTPHKNGTDNKNTDQKKATEQDANNTTNLVNRAESTINRLEERLRQLRESSGRALSCDTRKENVRTAHPRVADIRYGDNEEGVNNIDNVRPPPLARQTHSDPSSPIRQHGRSSTVKSKCMNNRRHHSVPRNTTNNTTQAHCNASTFTLRDMPFVVGKATGKSHSVKVNTQQLLSTLKNENKVLHQACLRVSKESYTGDLTALFRGELQRELAKLENELDKDIRMYDALQSHVQSIKDDAEQRLTALKDIDNLVTKIEINDTKIQRIQAQLSKLINDVITKSGCSPMRTASGHATCRQTREHLLRQLDLAVERRRRLHSANQVREHTISSLRRHALIEDECQTKSLPHKPKSMPQLHDNDLSTQLRDIQQLRRSILID